MRMRAEYRLGAMVAAVALCGAWPAIAQSVAPTTEAPGLAERVAAGDLPPLAERVPSEPAVITPHGSIGTYGGDIRWALRGGGDHNGILRVVGPQSLVRWNPDMTDTVPNIARDIEISAEATIYTFHLREGLLWSDGTPFTADDIVFAAQDVVLNPEMNPATPSAFVAGDAPMQVEAISATEVRVTFSAPYGRFLPSIAAPTGQHLTLFQRDYCSQFHPAYAAADALEAMIAKGQHADWTALFRDRCGDIEIPSRWSNPDRPVLDPWVIITGYTGNATQVVMERNAYFWQVDTEGQQLPYIDRLVFPVISDEETILLNAIAGDLDLQLRRITNVSNRPVLVANQELGDYELVFMADSDSNRAGLWFNQTARNEAVRSLIRDRRFREAFSHAIDRQEIIDAIYLGAAQPWQVGPLPQHPLYNEQLGTQHLEYDPDLASALLDEIGLTERDSEGFRLYPDGARVVIRAEFPVQNANEGDLLQFVADDLAAVGIQVTVQGLERTLYYDRAAANEHELHIRAVPGGLDPYDAVRAIISEHPLDSRQSLEWQRWYATGGAQGEEPTESMQRRMALFDEWKATADPVRGEELFREILQIAANEFEVMGIATSGGGAGIRRSNLMNVPDPILNAWVFASPAGTLVQQYYYR